MTSVALVTEHFYYDDVLLPATLGAGPQKQSSKQPTLEPVNGKREKLCCENCRSGLDDDNDVDSDEPRRVIYSCPDCGSSFGLAIALKYHIKKRHEPYRCNYCNFSSRELAVTKRHAREVHISEKRHHCPHCKYRAKRSTHLRRHIEARHKEGGSVPLFSCPQCEFTTLHAKSLKRHQVNNHGEATLQCEQCEYKATQGRDLKHHVKTVHEHVKDYDCPCCPYKTIHLGSLRNHIMAKHTDEKDHKCPHCPYRAVQSGNLKRHLQTKHPKMTQKTKTKV